MLRNFVRRNGIRLLLSSTSSRCACIFGNGYVPLGIFSVFFRMHEMYDAVRWRATRGLLRTTNRGKNGCGWLFHSHFLVVGVTCVPTTHVMHPSSMYVGGIHGRDDSSSFGCEPHNDRVRRRPFRRQDARAHVWQTCASASSQCCFRRGWTRAWDVPTRPRRSCCWLRNATRSDGREPHTR